MKKPRRAVSLRKLREHWNAYTTFRATMLAPSTIKRDYQKIEKRLARISKEAPKLNDAISIRDWLLANYSAETARRTLVQLNACCQWAMNSELIANNPFAGVTAQLRRPRPSEKAWAAFTRQERDIIIQEFEAQESWAAPWVKFLFWTGTRPEEAAALKWEHVSGDFRELLIAEALPVDMAEAQSTKNGRITRFPCNSRLQSLLRMQKAAHGDIHPWVFPAVQGGRFDYHNFQNRAWKPLVNELRRQGHVAFYLSQYHCRHTFITEGLKEGISVADMAYLCRVSTTVLYKHYLDRTRSITVPEF
jgi:integrase